MNITEFVQELAEICQFLQNTLYEGFQAEKNRAGNDRFHSTGLISRFRYMSYGFYYFIFVLGCSPRITLKKLSLTPSFKVCFGPLKLVNLH